MNKQPRAVYYAPPDAYVKGRGYRISVVVEGENGHHPTGTWPYRGRVGETVPYFWGPTLEDATQACEQINARMGVSKEDALKIVLDSMFDRQERRGAR